MLFVVSFFPQLFELLGLPLSVNPQPACSSFCSPCPCRSPFLRCSCPFAEFEGSTSSLAGNSLPLPWPLRCSSRRTLSRHLRVRGMTSVRSISVGSPFESSRLSSRSPRRSDIPGRQVSVQGSSGSTFSDAVAEDESAPLPHCCCCCREFPEACPCCFPSLHCGTEGLGDRGCGDIGAEELDFGWAAAARRASTRWRETEGCGEARFSGGPALMYEGWLLKESRWRRVWRPRYVMLFVVEEGPGCDHPCRSSARERLSCDLPFDSVNALGPLSRSATTAPPEAVLTTRVRESPAASPGFTPSAVSAGTEDFRVWRARCWDACGPSQFSQPQRLEESSLFPYGHSLSASPAMPATDDCNFHSESPTSASGEGFVPISLRNRWKAPVQHHSARARAPEDSESEGSGTPDRQETFRNRLSSTASSLSWEVISENDEGRSECSAPGSPVEREEDGALKPHMSRRVILAAFEKNPRCPANRKGAEQPRWTATAGSEAWPGLCSRQALSSEPRRCTYTFGEQRTAERQKAALVTLLGPWAPPPTEVFVVDCQQVGLST